MMNYNRDRFFYNLFDNINYFVLYLSYICTTKITLVTTS